MDDIDSMRFDQLDEGGVLEQRFVLIDARQVPERSPVLLAAWGRRFTIE